MKKIKKETLKERMWQVAIKLALLLKQWSTMNELVEASFGLMLKDDVLGPRFIRWAKNTPRSNSQGWVDTDTYTGLGELWKRQVSQFYKTDHHRKDMVFGHNSEGVRTYGLKKFENRCPQCGQKIL
jgi:hypothetical protein